MGLRIGAFDKDPEDIDEGYQSVLYCSTTGYVFPIMFNDPREADAWQYWVCKKEGLEDFREYNGDHFKLWDEYSHDFRQGIEGKVAEDLH